MATQTAGLKSAEPQLSLPTARPLASSRLVYLDNVRTLLITTVIIGHLSATYGVDADWYYREGGDVSPAVYGLLMVGAAVGIGFALGLFFMIAGYFTPAAYDRKGARRFLVDRLTRLGLPWLFFEVFINPLLHYVVDVHGGDCRGAFYDCQYQGSFWAYLQEYPRNIGSFAASPAWFIEVLLVFSLIYVLWRLAIARAPQPVPGGLTQPRPVPGNTTIALFALAIGLVSFIVRLWARAFDYFEPLHFEFARFPQYIALYVAGMWAYRHDWLAAFSDWQARFWRRVALACLLALPALLVSYGALSSGNLDERARGGLNWLSLTYSLWEGFLCVSMAIAVLAWFRRRFDHQGRLARTMSESTLVVYVLHPAIIVPFALALSGIQMNLSLKFLLVAPIAVALCYLAAYALRRVPFVRSVVG